MVAARHGSSVDGGGHVDDVNPDGENAFHGAVYRGGSIPFMTFLVEHGAKLDAVNHEGWMPTTAATGKPRQ